MPTALENGVPADFSETLAEIVRQTQAVKEDPVAGMGMLPMLHFVARGLPVWIQMLAAAQIYGQMPVGLTNLGNLKSEELVLGGCAPTKALFGGPLKNGFQISIISLDGKCTLACYGQYTAEDQAHIQNTLDTIASIVAEYAM